MRSVRRTSCMSVWSFSMRHATPCSTGCSSSNVSTLSGWPLSSMSSSACIACVNRPANRPANATAPAPSNSASAMSSGNISHSTSYADALCVLRRSTAPPSRRAQYIMLEPMLSLVRWAKPSPPSSASMNSVRPEWSSMSPVASES